MNKGDDRTMLACPWVTKVTTVLCFRARDYNDITVLPRPWADRNKVRGTFQCSEVFENL